MSDFHPPKFSDADVVLFGARLSEFPPFDDLPEEFRRRRHRCCEIAQNLFFNGGKLSDHGLKLKPGLKSEDVYRALSAWLSSFEPKHEHKIAAVGYAISEWFDEADGRPS
jgi:hypothetical protein